MNDILVSIIIVNYNTCALTCACIDSIFQNVHSCKFEVILVDNASSDNSVVEIKRRYESSVKLVASDYNLGFGRANNWGTKHASGQYLFLLNSDTVLRNDPFPYFLEFLHFRKFVFYNIFPYFMMIRLIGDNGYLINKTMTLKC